MDIKVGNKTVLKNANELESIVLKVSNTMIGTQDFDYENNSRVLPLKEKINKVMHCLISISPQEKSKEANDLIMDLESLEGALLVEITELVYREGVEDGVKLCKMIMQH